MPIQDYFRMQNVFSPKKQAPPLMPNRSVEDIFGSNTIRQPDDNIDVYGSGDDEDKTPATDAFKQSVLNPPQHQNPSLLRTLGVGALSALQGSNEPDPNDKTRVMVDGQAYQKRGVITDPDGTKRYVGGVKPKSFWESLGNKPFDTAQAGELMNMPNAQRLADWKIKTGGLKDAATLENKDEINKALSAQRYANAGAIPQRVDQGQQKIDVSKDQGQQKIDLAKNALKLNQEKLDHLMSRQDLSESEKAALANKYKQEQIRLQGEMQQNLQGTKGEQALEQIDARGDVQKDIQGLRGTQSLEQIDARGGNTMEQIKARGDEARDTKAAPSGNAGATSALPTQQKVQLQLKANKAKQEHPEWNKFIKTDENGMVKIVPPSGGGFFDSGPDKATYDAIAAYMNGEPGKAGPAPKEPPKPPPADGKTEPGRVIIYDMQGNRVASIPQSDVARLNKKKYTTVKPKP